MVENLSTEMMTKRKEMIQERKGNTSLVFCPTLCILMYSIEIPSLDDFCHSTKSHFSLFWDKKNLKFKILMNTIFSFCIMKKKPLSPP